MKKINRIVYLDYLRVFASFAVMILHISLQNWYSVDINSFEWQVFNIFTSSVRWSVPVFVMISGSLFLDKSVSLKTIYSKYILRLATSFVIWSTIYNCFFNGSPDDRLVFLIHGDYHMWFIFMIIGLYMCIPIISTITKDKNKEKYYLTLALLFAFIIPEAITLTKDFGSNLVNTAVNALNADISAMHMHIVLGYASYFVFGHFLSKVSIRPNQRLMIYALGLGGFIATPLLSSIVTFKTQSPCDHYYGNFNVNVLLEATAVFVFFKYRRYDTEEGHIIIQRLSKYSFGAYLVHELIIDQLDIHFGLNTTSFNPIFSIICIALIVFTASYSFSAILNNIPFAKKYMV